MIRKILSIESLSYNGYGEQLRELLLRIHKKKIA